MMYSKTLRQRRMTPAPGLLRNRFYLAVFGVFVWTLALFLRLFYVQVIEHDYYVLRANRQRQSVITLDPERGKIIDARGRDLAISIGMDSIYAIPEEMRDAHGTLEAINSIVPIDVPGLLARAQGRSFFWIARKIAPEAADQIRALKLPGLYFEQESRRFYPNKELASHVLGFVGLDNKGLSGVEYQYEQVVSGIPGKLLVLRDAKKRLLMTESSSTPLSSSAGRTLRLTIDSAIQHISEVELQTSIDEYGAESGSVIIMNPYTGEILALANAPSFNPNAYSQFNRAALRNRAIQDYFEPGSTFKTVVAAAALDRDLVTPDKQLDCQMGSILVAGHLIHDHKPFGVLSFRQVLEKSSDVGMIKVGLMLGPDNLYQYGRMFGFGQKTGIDLPGEAAGVLRNPNKWSAISIGAVSMGQEVGVSALQVLTMMASVGNGGYLPVPHVVAAISDSTGEMKPTVFGRPQPLTLKHDAIETLKGILRGVVSPVGTGNAAAISGYSVAGKTGTAQVIGPSGTYADGGYIASFVGYTPASNPAIAMIAVLNNPKKQYHGGEVAAPLFRRIGQQVLKYLDIPPDQIADNPEYQASSAFPRVTTASFLPEGVEPAAFTPPEQHHKLVNASDDDKASELVMPSFYHKTASEAVQTLTAMKIHFRLVGSGSVVRQWPEPGMLLPQNDLCIIMLSDSTSSNADPNVSRK